jgi:hypothetical protein
MTMPEPLTTPACDLRSFPFMPLDTHRLLKSETWMEAADNPKLGHALICLWCEAWHQVPAGSLPDKHGILARLAMCTPDEWEHLRTRALQGWVRCSDGRLYHPVVAEKALEAMLEKLSHRRLSAAGNKKRWNAAADIGEIDETISSVRQRLAALSPQSRALNKRAPSGAPDGTPDGTPDVIATALPEGSQQTTTRTGTGTVKETTEADASASSGGSEEDLFWRRLKELEAKRISRDRCLQLLKATGNDFSQANQILDGAEGAKKPSGYIGGAIKRLEAEAGGGTPVAVRPDLPAWVNDRRAAGIPVERTANNNWRCQGAILNDAGEAVGF